MFNRLASVLLPHDWLTAQLTGRHTTDRGDASGTGWWSPADESYRPDLLALVDDTVAWEDVLPEVLGPRETAGQWSEHGALVAPGTGDNMAAALGIGLQPGDLALSLGTSGTAFCVSDLPTADDTGVVAGFADATSRYLPLVCTLNATKVTDTMARLLGVDSSGLDALALAAPPGAGGLVLVPHLDGERTPNRPDATGTLTGLRTDASREQLARAAVEGVVCNLLAGADELTRWVPNLATGRIFLIGGGARSAAYRQVVADRRPHRKSARSGRRGVGARIGHDRRTRPLGRRRRCPRRLRSVRRDVVMLKILSTRAYVDPRPLVAERITAPGRLVGVPSIRRTSARTVTIDTAARHTMEMTTAGMTNAELSQRPVIGWICLDSTNPRALADWWQKLLGGTTRVDQDGDVRLESGPIPLLFLAVSEPKTVKNRVHLDLRVTDYDDAVARALALGAVPADDIYRGDAWRVLRDLEGNEFCILRPED